MEINKHRMYGNTSLANCFVIARLTENLARALFKILDLLKVFNVIFCLDEGQRLP